MRKEITSEDQEHLEALNNAIEQAIKNRTEWLDKKMHEYSELQPGDDIYDIKKGYRVGKVKSLYRYHAEQNKLYDDSLSWDYKYNPCSWDGVPDTGFTNNTSSQIGSRFGTREQAIEYREMELRSLKSS